MTQTRTYDTFVLFEPHNKPLMKNIKVGNSVVHITRPVVFPYKLDPILPSHLFYLQDRPFLVPFDNLGIEAGARAIFFSRHVAKRLQPGKQ